MRSPNGNGTMASTEAQLRASEIKDVLLQEIEQYEQELKVEEVGEVLEVKDGVARIYGLTKAMASELLEITSSETGETVPALALNLEEDNIGAVVMGDWTGVQEGDTVRRSGRVLDIPVGAGYLGRVVDALGQPIDGRPADRGEDRRFIDIVAPGIVFRQPVNEPLQTGIKAIDAMIPIGRGQRELIIGDRGTGKSAIAIDTIINQKGERCDLRLRAIGQKAVEGRDRRRDAARARRHRLYGCRRREGERPRADAVHCALRRVARWPSTSCGRARHARRLRRPLEAGPGLPPALAAAAAPAGREAYPGDVFYLHSRLLERAAKLSDEHGGGSLTALPIIETQAGDVSAYIPTNVISITDGQIFLESDLFYAGVRPAINVGISVSRVGGCGADQGDEEGRRPLRLDLAQYRELEAFAQFGSSSTRRRSASSTRGQRLGRDAKQPQYAPLPVDQQVMIIYAGDQRLPGRCARSSGSGASRRASSSMRRAVTRRSARRSGRRRI